MTSNHLQEMFDAECTSIGDYRGVVVIDSVDLYLEDLEVYDPVTGPAIAINNSGLDIGVQGGMFHLNNIKTDKSQRSRNRHYRSRRK